MKNTDKFLGLIVVGVVALVVVAFAVVILRPKPAYQPEDTPEGVTHNYLLALQLADYERAYIYLSPTLKGYPVSVAAFTETVLDHKEYFHSGDSPTLQIESTRVVGDRAFVIVRETTFHARGLLDNNEDTSTFEVDLVRDPERGAWKIISSDSYWLWCWEYPAGCQ